MKKIDINDSVKTLDFGSLTAKNRIAGTLVRNGVKTIGELCSYDDIDLLSIPYIGKKVIEDIKVCLASHGLTLNMKPEDLKAYMEAEESPEPDTKEDAEPQASADEKPSEFEEPNDSEAESHRFMLSYDDKAAIAIAEKVATILVASVANMRKPSDNEAECIASIEKANTFVKTAVSWFINELFAEEK